ncbi:uncharacterized protein LOC144453266 [Glandiceps talaboti]
MIQVVSSEKEYPSNPYSEYLHQLRVVKKVWKLASGYGYVIADCEKATGILLKEKYCVVEQQLVQLSNCLSWQTNTDYLVKKAQQRLYFLRRLKKIDETKSAILLKCSCEERINDWNAKVKGDFQQLIAAEVAHYCVHAKAIQSQIFMLSATSLPTQDIPCVQQLQNMPLLSAVTMDQVHLVYLKNTSGGKKLACKTCKHGVTSCEYVGMYRTWLDDNDISVPESRNDVPRTSNFKHITYERIPYPLSEKLQDVYDRQVDGDAPFPEYLIPQIPESGKHSFCEHGCEWDDGDPVVNGWICDSVVNGWICDPVVNGWICDPVVNGWICDPMVNGWICGEGLIFQEHHTVAKVQSEISRE